MELEADGSLVREDGRAQRGLRHQKLLRLDLLLLHPVTEDVRAQPPCLLTRRAANLSKVPS